MYFNNTTFHTTCILHKKRYTKTKNGAFYRLYNLFTKFNKVLLRKIETMFYFNRKYILSKIKVFVDESISNS